MRYRLVIFDFDGTLADSFPWFAGVFNDVADRYGFRRMAPGELEALRGMGGRELVRHLGVPRWKLPLVARRFRALTRRDRHSVSLFPGVDGLLGRLHGAGVELAVVSSNARDNVAHVLGPRNAPLIRHWACGASLFGKARAFRRVLRRSRTAPADALAVGDEVRDLEAARAAGIPFGAVSWGYATAESLRRAGPAVTFARVEEIGELLLGR